MRTMLFYGNCQTRALADVATQDPAIADRYSIRYLPSHDLPLGKRITPAPTDEDLANCTLFCEQGESQKPFSHERLPDKCQTVRFPPLDFNVLWPFHVVNPFHREDATDSRWHRFPFGDRVLVQQVERGASVSQALAYYRERWLEYGIKLERLLEIERVRLTARDARCDFGMAADVLDNFRDRPLFYNFNHARSELCVAVAERLFARCSQIDAGADWDGVLQGVVDGRGDPVLNSSEIPIHPTVAQTLKLEWYDPQATFLQYSGERYTYDEYLQAFVEYCVAAKSQTEDRLLPLAQRDEVLPAIDGAATMTGSAFGLFQGRIGGPMIRFEIIANGDLRTVELQAFCPVFHTAPISITMTVAGNKQTLNDVQPNSVFTIACDAAVRAGQKVTVDVRSTGWFNLLNRGDGSDDRDLSLVLMTLVVR